MIAFPNRELARRVFSCGSSFIFSGPLQPAQLGAGIASACIHLSPEIERLQRRLLERIELFDRELARSGIALRAPASSPIRFVEIGAEEAACAIAKRLLRAGFFVNTAVFPAVARGRAGVRVMLTCQQTLEDVSTLVNELAEALRS